MYLDSPRSDCDARCRSSVSRRKRSRVAQTQGLAHYFVCPHFLLNVWWANASILVLSLMFVYIYIYIYIYICTDYSVWCIWRLLRLVKNTTAVDILNCINCKMCSGHQRLWRMQNYPMYTHTHRHTHTHTLPCVGIIEEMQAGCAFIMLLFSAPKILSDLCPVKVTVSVCLSKQRVGLWLY